MEILQTLYLTFTISQGYRRDFPNNYILTLQVLVKLKCIHSNLKRGNVVVLMLRSLFVLGVVGNMKTSA